MYNLPMLLQPISNERRGGGGGRPAASPSCTLEKYTNQIELWASLIQCDIQKYFMKVSR